MSKKVFIGVGHGGTDSGAVKYIVEKEYTLKTAFALSVPRCPTPINTFLLIIIYPPLNS